MGSFCPRDERASVAARLTRVAPAPGRRPPPCAQERTERGATREDPALIILALTAASATAETFHSPHGFSFEVPQGWEPVPAADLAKEYPSSSDMQVECGYFSPEQEVFLLAGWIPGRFEATDLASTIRLAARDPRAVAREMARLQKGFSSGAASVTGVDPKLWTLSLEITPAPASDELPMLVAMRAMGDGVCYLIVYATPYEKALHLATFDRVVRTLTVSPGKEYVPLPEGLACIAFGLLLLVGLCVPARYLRQAEQRDQNSP